MSGHRLGEPVLKCSPDSSKRLGDTARDTDQVYVTLRESRETARKNQNFLMKGYMLKKSKLLLVLPVMNH